MNDFAHRIQDGWERVFDGILEEAARLREAAVLAFDLDSTLFDNRPRQARILREFGEARGLRELIGCEPDHWTSGWDMKAAMRSCGLPEAQIEASYDDARTFWQERFFTSPYCRDDIDIRGAAAYTRAVAETGALLCYVTGRHEAMRAGSVEAMEVCKMALPGGNVHLLMKPTLAESDDEYKRVAHEQLGRMGRVIAAFDNEPIHVNDYKRKFPDATVIHLATDHSGREATLLDGIVSVPHFP